MSFNSISKLKVPSFYASVMKLSAVRALIVVLSFAGSVALSRAIGPEGRGLIAWFIAAASVAMMFAQCGVEVLNRRFTAEDTSRGGGLAVLSIQACLLGTLLVTPFFLYFALSNEIGYQHVGMLIVANVSIFFMALVPCLNSVQLGLNHIKDFMWGTVLQKLGNVVLILALIAFGAITPLNALLAFMLSYLMQVALTCYTLRGSIKARKPGAFAFALTKKSYMFHTYVRNILNMTAASVVPLVLGLQHSLASAGLYAASMIIIDAINKTFGMISTYALPQIAGAKTQAEKNKLKKSIQLMSFWGMVAIAGVWAAIAGWAIPMILGEEFREGVMTFRILCLYMVFSSLNDANQAIVMAGSEKSIIAASPLVMLISVSAAAWILIPLYGAMGGAIALAAGSFMAMIASWICTRLIPMTPVPQPETEPKTPDEVIG